MDKIAFAETIIAGRIQMPKDRSLAALFAYASVDELREKGPFDPSRVSEYLAVVEDGKQVVNAKREEERKRQEELFRSKVSENEKKIWGLLRMNFFYRYGQESVNVEGSLEWRPSALLSGPTLTGAGVQYKEIQCLAKGRKIELKPHLETWVYELAERLVRENRPFNSTLIIKEMLLAKSTLEITCPYANPLIEPSNSCSIYASGSSRSFACDTVQLTLQTK